MDTNRKVSLVSAVITTHNRKELAGKAIDSVLMQSYPNMELIVVDDASEQDAADYIRHRAEKDGFRCIHISAENSKGGNHARNVGAVAATGEYIAFLDDEWMKEKQLYRQNIWQTARITERLPVSGCGK